MYSLLLKISDFYRWLILSLIWALFVILWYLLIFRHFQELTSLCQLKVDSSITILDKLKSTMSPEILNVCKIEEKDINFLSSLIINLIEESKISLSKCTIACQDGLCDQCINFCVYGDFDNIKVFFDSIDDLKFFKFCYFNLRINTDLSISANFAVKSCQGVIIPIDKNQALSIKNERNPFEEQFNIQCLGLVNMAGNNFLLAKFENELLANKILKLGLLDIVDGYKLISLDSKNAIFENIKSLRTIKKYIGE